MIMRNEKKWCEKIEPLVIKKLFTPRIIKDFEVLQLKPEINENNLFIYGSKKATGKTLFACQVLLGWEKKSYLQNLNLTTCFITLPTLLNELKSAFSKEDGEMEVLQKYQGVDVLVLDDFGVFKISEWTYVTIYNLLNYRYEHLKTTIFTSNFSIAELQEFWQDDRITSRISRMCVMFKKERI